MSIPKDERAIAAPPAEELGRLDLIIEEAIEEGGEIVMRVVPDPRRYDEIDIDGEVHYIDRFTRTLFPLRLFKEMNALPFYELKPRIESALGYGAERALAVTDELAGHPMRDPSVMPAPHRQAREEEQTINTPFLSLDICNSTQLRRHNAVAFDSGADILLRELQILVGQFEATILKPTGDGFIAYLPHASFTRQCDMIVDLGTSMIHLARDAVGTALQAAGHPKLDIRIGADYGAAAFRQKTNKVTGLSWPHVDSDALNLAVKIEQSAAPNTMRIGWGLYQLLHVQWLARAQRVTAESLPAALKSYPIYEVA